MPFVLVAALLLAGAPVTSASDASPVPRGSGPVATTGSAAVVTIWDRSPVIDTGSGVDLFTVWILAGETPNKARVESSDGQRQVLFADSVTGEGTRPAYWRGGYSRWKVEVRGKPTRVYLGFLSARAIGARLEFELDTYLEDYVAQVVAAQSTADATEAELEARAIVARSFAIGSSLLPRHDRTELCDEAHCLLLRGQGLSAKRLEQARAAAHASEGRLLLQEDGQPALEVMTESSAGGAVEEILLHRYPGTHLSR